MLIGQLDICLKRQLDYSLVVPLAYFPQFIVIFKSSVFMAIKQLVLLLFNLRSSFIALVSFAYNMEFIKGGLWLTGNTSW